jgi:hypothetical protein
MKKPFAHPLSAEDLYWCGVIHADGSISRQYLRLKIGQRERHLLEEFLRFLGQDSKITHVVRQTNFGHSELYTATTRKSVVELLDLGVKSTPVTELYSSRHFWRGLIDGDGSVGIYAGKPSIHLCSGKLPDIAAFSSWVGSLFQTTGPKPYQNARGAWAASVGHSKAQALARYLYADSYSAVVSKSEAARLIAALPDISRWELPELVQ